MNEERLRILNMLAEGKIDARQAAALLDALGGARSASGASPPAPPASPRYLRVVVE